MLIVLSYWKRFILSNEFRVLLTCFCAANNLLWPPGGSVRLLRSLGVPQQEMPEHSRLHVSSDWSRLHRVWTGCVGPRWGRPLPPHPSHRLWWSDLHHVSFPQQVGVFSAAPSVKTSCARMINSSTRPAAKSFKPKHTNVSHPRPGEYFERGKQSPQLIFHKIFFYPVFRCRRFL